LDGREVISRLLLQTKTYKHNILPPKVIFYSNETGTLFPQASKITPKEILRIISDMFTLSETNIYALKTGGLEDDFSC